eukprot:CAMPEP_0202387862 /NCGR_PEP_ID=MMETSP1127-20130417/74463_1 /ASSEMBLY_ACC=CAM_ASM_000462 /TAXON_ID=3047 /ORGANISM="Dunaliella tertiolecta, Strain CCMP1320" /LENGTH=155 /DNA_ID=CAMNT_0048989053 /DNA_START=6 /DNA_END=469 /DNA_ORIENTATION=+
MNKLQAEARMSEMNKHAYQSVLRALFAKNTSNAETMKLMLKLRKELNVTSDEHKEWLQELIKARNEGTLGQLLQSGLEQANPAPVAAAGNGWAVSQPYQHQQQAYAQSGMASSEDLSEVDEGGSDSSYSREFLHLQRRQGGAGTSYGGSSRRQHA